MFKNKENIDLTTGPVWQVMFKFALPIFLGTLFQSFYTIADAAIIGNFAGKEALAAIESVLVITKLPVNFFIGLASGATIIISQYFGAKKLDKVSSASHNAIMFALFGGAFLSLLGILVADSLIDITQVPTEVAPLSKIYLKIYFGGMLFSLLYNIAAGIFRAVGNSKTPFYFLLAANILNIILDFVFVAGFGWGVLGAAVATVLAALFSVVLILLHLFNTSLSCRIYWHKLRFNKLHLEEMVKLGLPIGMQATLYPIANTLVQSSINQLGVDNIAAWAVAGKLDFLIWHISSSFAYAIATFVAQNYGAGKYHRLRQGVQAGLSMSIGTIAVISVIIYFFSAIGAGLLINDQAVIAINTNIMRFFAPAYFVYAITEALPAALKGTGDTLRPMLISVLTIFVFRIVWILYIVPLKMNIYVVLGCFPASWLLTALVFIFLYIHKVKKLQLEAKYSG